MYGIDQQKFYSLIESNRFLVFECSNVESMHSLQKCLFMYSVISLWEYMFLGHCYFQLSICIRLVTKCNCIKLALISILDIDKKILKGRIFPVQQFYLIVIRSVHRYLSGTYYLSRVNCQAFKIPDNAKCLLTLL